MEEKGRCYINKKGIIVTLVVRRWSQRVRVGESESRTYGLEEGHERWEDVRTMELTMIRPKGRATEQKGWSKYITKLATSVSTVEERDDCELQCYVMGIVRQQAQRQEEYN